MSGWMSSEESHIESP